MAVEWLDASRYSCAAAAVTTRKEIQIRSALGCFFFVLFYFPALFSYFFVFSLSFFHMMGEGGEGDCKGGSGGCFYRCVSAAVLVCVPALSGYVAPLPGTGVGGGKNRCLRFCGTIDGEVPPPAHACSMYAGELSARGLYYTEKRGTGEWIHIY